MRATGDEREAVPFHPAGVLPDRVAARDAAPIEIRMIRVSRRCPPQESRAVLAAIKHHD